MTRQERRHRQTQDRRRAHTRRRGGYWNRVALMVALTLVTVSCNYGRQPDPTAIALPTPTLTVNDVYTVERGSVVESTVFTGKVVLASQQELFFSTNGRIKAVYVESGDEVAPDQIIAALDTRDLEFEVQDARLALELAQQQLEEAEKQLEFDTQSAQIELDMATRRLDSLRAQVQPDPTELYGQEQQVEQAQLILDRLEQGVELRLRTEVTRAALTLQRALAALADAQIVAPFAGEVRLFPGLVEGNPTQAWEPVASIVDPDTLQIEANLVPADLETLHEGMPVRIEPVNRPGVSFGGEITQMPQPFGSGMDAATKIALEPDGRLGVLRAGMAVNILVELQRVDNTLWIPPQAMRGSEDIPFVVVQDGKDLREVEVKVGLRNDERVQIVSGLNEGDVVVGS